MFGVLVSIAPNKSAVQAGGACLLLLNVLFCGYIVAPTVIPAYYTWIHWLVPSLWVYCALLLNEFVTNDYPDGEGEEILMASGILYISRVWIAYCVLLCVSGIIHHRVHNNIGSVSSLPANGTKTKNNRKAQN